MAHQRARPSRRPSTLNLFAIASARLSCVRIYLRKSAIRRKSHGGFIYDHTGAQIAAISNNTEVRKFAIGLNAPIVGSLAILAVVGLGFMWLLAKVIPMIGWLKWTAPALSGLLLWILAWHLHIRSVIKRRMDRLCRKVTSDQR